MQRPLEFHASDVTMAGNIPRAFQRTELGAHGAIPLKMTSIVRSLVFGNPKTI